MLSITPNGEDDSRNVQDANVLLDECLRHGIPVDWWYSKANTVRMIAGEQSSEAYLLLKKTDLDGDEDNSIEPLSRVFYNHKITLDATPDGSPFNILGWAFHSARAITATDDLVDKDTIYLVRFCDLRYFFAKQPCLIGVSGALVYEARTGFNVVSQTVNDSGMSYDESDPVEFPYDPGTIAGSDPYTWETLLETLWHSTAFTDDFGAVIGFSNQAFPTDGTYPEQVPLDIRPENHSTWSLFCNLLHGTGNEVYPQYDGTFLISPIDESFGVGIDGTELADHVTNAIEIGNVSPEWNRIPEFMSMTFLRRYTLLNIAAGITARNINNYISTSPIATTGASSILFGETLPDDLLKSSGTYEVQSAGILGATEDVTTIGRSMVNGGVAGDVTFAKFVLKKYLKARLGEAIDATFPFFINSTPQPSYNEVLYYFDRDEEGNPAPRSHFLNDAPPSPGCDSLPEIPGGGSTDRLVGGDDTDEVPETLYPKIVDHSTFDSDLHTVVYAQAVDHAAGPPLNRRVKLFTTKGTGTTGPPGSDGADGTNGTNGTNGADGDTVDEGYAIDVSHAGTVATVGFDPTEITAFSAAFQIFYHLAAHTGPTDPRWLTFTGYDATKDQFWWQRSSSFKFQTTASYSNTANQLLFNQSDVWSWKTTSGYNDAAGVKQLLRHVGPNWEWVADTRPASIALTTDVHDLKLTMTLEDGTSLTATIHVKDVLNALEGYIIGNNQSIGHDGAGSTEWQDDGVCS